MAKNNTYNYAGVEFESPEKFSFVGLGPKNYDPDKRLWEEVCLNLTFHPEIDASHIEVIVHDQVVNLRGWVPTRKMKKLATRFLNQMSGLKKIINEINVPPYYQELPHEISENI